MIIQSKRVLHTDGTEKHIRVSPGELGRYALLPGDPARTDIIAGCLKDAELLANNREHRIWTGYLYGERVTVASTGMGCPSAAIAVEELIHCGCDTFIRVGTAGRLCDASEDEKLDGVIVSGAIRDEGTTMQYIPAEFPALADRHITAALSRAAKVLNLNFSEGIAQTKDSFYGQHDPESMPNAALLAARWEAWRRGRAMCSEMECAAVFIVSGIRGCRAGAIMSFKEMSDAIRTACLALTELIDKDNKEG